MINRPFAFAAAVLMFVAPLTAGAQAPAGAQSAVAAEAAGHFRRGVELYKEADYAAALLEFRRAYEIEPRYQALFNMGEAYYQLQDYASALRTFEKYLKDGGDKIPADRRDEVQQEIDKLRLRVATLRVTTSVPDIEVAIDDVPVGKTPFAAPLMVSAGRRKVTAQRAGKPLLVQTVEVVGGDTKDVALTIPEEGGGPVKPPPDLDKKDTGHPRSVPVVPWIATGVLAAGAVVTGVLALGAVSQVNTDLKVFPGNANDISSARSKTFGLALATDILTGAAIVMGGVSIYLTVSAGSPKKPAASALQLQAGPRSILLTGTF